MSKNDDLVPSERLPVDRFGGRWGPAATFEIDASEPGADLRHYWNTLVKRRWMVFTVAFVVTTVVTIVNFKAQPVYEARVAVEVEAESPELQSLNDLYRGMPADEAFLRTQVQVLESDSLAWQTIQQLGLADSPEFNAPPKRRPRSATEEQISLATAFRDHLRVEWVKNSRVLEVAIEARDPRLAAQMANALVSNYAEYNFRKRFDATRRASGWMEQQLDELKLKVEKSQKALVDYERRNVIVNVSEKQNVEEQRLAQLSNDFTGAQNLRLEKQALHELVNSNEAQVAFVAQSELLIRLEEKHGEVRTQLAETLGQFGPNFPKVIRLKNQLNEIQGLLERERKRLVARIRNDYQAAVEREKLLGAALARQKEEVGKLNQLLIQHNLLKREFETNQQLYDSLLRHLKDATVSAGLRATNIHVVDPALPPAVPVRPKKKQNIAIGLLAGLALGVIFALFTELLDNSVKTAEDLEHLIAIPTLAIIPRAFRDHGKKHWLRSGRERGEESQGPVALTVLKRPNSLLAESYRALRTSILLSTPGRPPQVLLVTSSHPNEGKSCTCLNLALTLAQRGDRVVIIDGDLRKPAVASFLGINNGKGLSSVLTGVHGVDEALQRVEVLPNLWAMAGGPRPPNPADLLSSSGMRDVLAELRERFDFIVIDSPPVMLVTDATILTTQADGIILVVESGATIRSAILRVRMTLEGAGGKILGAVLNKIDSRQDGYYGGYYSRSYYGYYAQDEDQSKVSP